MEDFDHDSVATSSSSVMTLEVKLGTYWKVELECLDSFSLYELHDAIQDAVGFDDDHLYEFYVARGERNRNRIEYPDMNICLSEIFPLPPKNHLHYLFDYGDCWMFRIGRTRKKIKDPENGVEYPVVIKETGEKPIQYESFDDDDF